MMKYFITYTRIENNIPLFGNVDITVDSAIKCIEDIREIECGICNKYGYNNVVVLSWAKF